MATTTESVVDTENQREGNGRFGKGNTFGRGGNPFAGKVGALRARILQEMDEEKIASLTLKLYEMAMDGHFPALKLLLAYTVGKSTFPVEAMDFGDVQEWEVGEAKPEAKFTDAKGEDRADTKPEKTAGAERKDRPVVKERQSLNLLGKHLGNSSDSLLGLDSPLFGERTFAGEVEMVVNNLPVLSGSKKESRPSTNGGNGKKKGRRPSTNGANGRKKKKRGGEKKSPVEPGNLER